MEFAVEFATFCNICFRNEGLRKIQESDHLLNTLTVLIENKVIIKRHEIYLCLNCCEKLESYDQFKEMCLRNFLDFRIEYFGLKKKLETCNDPNIEKKLRSFLETKIYEASDPLNTCESGKSVKFKNDKVSTQLSNKRSIGKEEKTMDLKYDFRSVRCKTEKVDGEEKEEYKLHTESDLENNDYHSELPVPIEHIKVESFVNEDIGSTECTSENELRGSSVLYTKEAHQQTAIDLTQYQKHAATSTLNTVAQPPNKKIPRYECKVCKKMFLHASSLTMHLRIHTGEKPFSCTICNKSFPQSNALRAHQVVHIGEKPYSCSICNKPYSQLGSLIGHERSHSEKRVHLCNICHRTFTLANGLKKHMLVHTGEKPFTCGVCNKNFRRSENLKRHERVHTGEKPYACSMCDKTFSGSGNLRIHERIHTGEKPYACRGCDKAFTHINHLKAHERLHTGEKPYECTVCNERFTQINSFKVHKLTHTGEKPHTCGVCKKTFTQTSTLREHERIHTGVKPYSCEICKKTFRQRSNYRFHKRKPCVKQEVVDTVTEQCDTT